MQSNDILHSRSFVYLALLKRIKMDQKNFKKKKIINLYRKTIKRFKITVIHDIFENAAKFLAVNL